MYHDLRRQYYWSGMEKHVGDYVRRCLTCQQIKAEHQRPVGLLQSLEVTEWKWEHVTMDFVTHLSLGSDFVWVIVDQLTKSAHVFSCGDDLHFIGIRQVVYMGRLSSYMQYQYLLCWIEIPCLRLIFGRVSREPWGHN